MAHKPLKEKHVSVVMEDTLAGLSYLHDSGIVHCDIKGHNILVCSDATVKLADFGAFASPVVFLFSRFPPSGLIAGFFRADNSPPCHGRPQPATTCHIWPHLATTCHHLSCHPTLRCPNRLVLVRRLRAAELCAEVE